MLVDAAFLSSKGLSLLLSDESVLVLKQSDGTEFDSVDLGTVAFIAFFRLDGRMVLELASLLVE